MINPKISVMITDQAKADHQNSMYLSAVFDLNTGGEIKSGGVTILESNAQVCKVNKSECRKDKAAFTSFVDSIQDALETYKASGEAPLMFKTYNPEGA